MLRNDTTGLFTIVTANFTFENISAVVYCNHSKETKEWHHVTDIKGQLDRKYYGLITPEEDLPQSIYSQLPVGMIRKQCHGCKRSHQHRYFVRSRFRLLDRDLKMFQSYEIVNATRVRTVKFLQPELSRFTDGLGMYYPNYAFTVSDSREISLSVAEAVARMLQ